MQGNICRCGCYQRIVSAVRSRGRGSLEPCRATLKNHDARRCSASGAPRDHRERQPPLGAEGHERIRAGDACFAAIEALAFPAYPHGGQGLPNGVVTDPHIFVSIAIRRHGHHRRAPPEMGTGSRTSIPMIIADEMEADWSRVKILQAPGDEPRYGNQDTDRLAQHPPSHPAGARDGRRRCAACSSRRRRRDWGVGVDEVVASDHEVMHKIARHQHRLRRARASRDGAADPGARCAPLQGREGVPLRRQGRRADLRSSRHHDGQGASMPPT